jgi:hypothetical protein
MSTTRQLILNQLEIVLKAVSSVKYVELERSIPIDLDTLPLPCVFVYSGKENRVKDERAVIGKETWDWEVSLEIWTNGNVESIIGEIHSALWTNRSLGGYSVMTIRDSIEGIYVIDEDSDTKSIILNYIITYRHALGIM